VKNGFFCHFGVFFSVFIYNFVYFKKINALTKKILINNNFLKIFIDIFLEKISILSVFSLFSLVFFSVFSDFSYKTPHKKKKKKKNGCGCVAVALAARCSAAHFAVAAVLWRKTVGGNGFLAVLGWFWCKFDWFWSILRLFWYILVYYDLNLGCFDLILAYFGCFWWFLRDYDAKRWVAVAFWQFWGGFGVNLTDFGAF
jgi:hypothetical protein